MYCTVAITKLMRMCIYSYGGRVLRTFCLASPTQILHFITTGVVFDLSRLRKAIMYHGIVIHRDFVVVSSFYKNETLIMAIIVVRNNSVYETMYVGIVSL